MATVDPELLDPDTPPDVVITERTRARITDPTLGEPLASPRGPQPPAKHRLVTIGDSLTHGMSNGAVSAAERSWPMLVAKAIGNDDFTSPSYGGPLSGLPVNIEVLLRRLEDKVGPAINPLELLTVPVVLQRALDGNEDYWEGRADDKPPVATTRHTNLAIYGWDIRDALSYTAGRARAVLEPRPKDTLLSVLPNHDIDIAARSVLEPYGPEATQIGAAAQLAADGGIDTLVVIIGANNALETVVRMDVVWSDDGYDDLDRNGSFTVWRPTHFAAEYAALVAAIRSLNANRVILATVPHVTIAPIARGLNPDRPGEKWRDGSRFFPYYTYPWVAETSFRTNRHPHLTHQKARAVDSAIDQYNEAIEMAVRTARRQGLEWYLLDVCGIFDSMAQRRYVQDEEAAEKNSWQPYPFPAPIAHLTTQFFVSTPQGRQQGGIIGLDGVHPTLAGYGILAHEVLSILGVAGIPSTPIDFTALLAADPLNSNPPALVKRVLDMASPFMNLFGARIR